MKGKRLWPRNLDRAQLLKYIDDQAKLEEFKPVQIFYCYAHEDEKLLKKLEEHLSPLKRSNGITAWPDQEIHGGTDGVKEIYFYLNTADIILLLISPSFIASNLCYSEQMQKALERHQKEETVIIPVILRPTFWVITSIGMLQGLPKDSQPITTWSNQDVAFLDVVLGIWDIIKHREGIS